ncbi:MAG: DUF177 domain-containing protein [Proteobacteria bacterium]|nr:DUF177 domain-containing protein [Pseudomonadota bacterium]
MTTQTEFPHLIPAAKIGREPFKTSFEANPRQLELLAKRYAVLTVDSLTGYATLIRENDGMTISATGHFKAQVTQACVTTLEPVQDTIEEDFEAWFLDESQAKSFKKAKKLRADADIEDPFNGDEDEETMMASERDEPEPVTNGQVDVGELVAQYVSLAINPYPHSEKAKAMKPLDEVQEPEKPNPFAVLKELKSK